jgi:DNA helicase II / ATP-dependent DNA helicase PcrA
MAYTKYKKTPVKKELRVIRNWSNLQQNIFADISSEQGNTQVIARAGTGKTSTIVEGMFYAPDISDVLFCAFAKASQEELEKRSPPNSTVKTFHGLGYAACRRAFPRLGKIDNKGEKLHGYIGAERGTDDDTYDVRCNIANTVSLAKGYLSSSPEEIDSIIDHHGIDLCSDTREAFITTVLKVMKACKNDTNRIDFDDMVWFPIVHGLSLNKYGLVFIDEAQDLNLAQIELALGSVKTNGRIISVGDDRQAIYGWRGADSKAIENIVTRMQCKTLPLNITYRCGRAIVEMAQSIVPDLEAAQSVHDGHVERVTSKFLNEHVKPGDFVLSRTNAPMIRGCLDLLKAGIPANIQGKDIGEGLIYMIKKSKAASVPAFLGWLEEWKNTEVERLTAKRRDSSLVQDKAEMLENFCEGTRDITDVKKNIKTLFSTGDDSTRVMFSTVHRAKGMERENVFLLENTFKPGKNVEEDNIWYVGITRAKNNLYLVNKQNN